MDRVGQWLVRVGPCRAGQPGPLTPHFYRQARPAWPPNPSLLSTGEPGPQTPHFYRQARPAWPPKPSLLSTGQPGPPNPSLLSTGPARPPTPHFYWQTPHFYWQTPRFYWPTPHFFGQPLASIGQASLLLARPSPQKQIKVCVLPLWIRGRQAPSLAKRSEGLAKEVRGWPGDVRVFGQEM